MVNKNHDSSGSRSANRGSDSERARVSQNRAQRSLSLRRRGRYGADSSGERINVVGGRRVNSFRLNGRHYADMPGLRHADHAAKAEKKYRYMIFWKPYGVDVRFTGDHSPSELDYYIDAQGVLPVNLLDKDAEGLMILTDDPKFRALLTHPMCAERRVFLAQVENIPDEEIIESLHKGAVLTDKGRMDAVDCEVIPAPKLPSRSTPIRERKSIPAVWTEIRTLSGAVRGIRKIMAQHQHPVLRLVLWGFGPVSLTGMVPGMCRDFRYEEMRWIESTLEKAENSVEKNIILGASARSKASHRVSSVKRHSHNAGRFACADLKKQEKKSGSRASSVLRKYSQLGKEAHARSAAPSLRKDGDAHRVRVSGRNSGSRPQTRSMHRHMR